MRVTSSRLRHLWAAMGILTNCAPSLPPDVIVIPAERPPAGYEYALPAPLEGGPFPTYFEALAHACQRLMSLPEASSRRVDLKRLGNVYVQYSRDESTEYCAWVYYTPANAYELSLIATPAVQNRSSGNRFCSLPRRVVDPRYADDSRDPDKHLKYAFAIHSHPTPRIFTKEDIVYLLETERYIQETLHDNGQLRLGMAAFFSREERSEPACDGFFLFSTTSRQVHMWTMDEQGQWSTEDVATIDAQRNNKTGKWDVTITEH